MKTIVLFVVFSFYVLFSSVAYAQQGQYMSLSEFLDKAFPVDNVEQEKSEKAKKPYQSQTLWLKDDQKRVIKKIMGHEFTSFRIRYWTDGQKTAWVLEEIGKEHPITMGVVIAQQQIKDFSILEFRESRGWEIKYDFYTQQFLHATLKVGKKDKRKLSNTIDGITGATLSVRATKKVAKLALYLDQQVAAVESTHGEYTSTH